MNGLSLTVKPELRPAIYHKPLDDKDHFSVCNVLVHTDRNANAGKFVCEFKDGKVSEVDAKFLRFTDSNHYFNEFSW